MWSAPGDGHHGVGLLGVKARRAKRQHRHSVKPAGSTRPSTLQAGPVGWDHMQSPAAGTNRNPSRLPACVEHRAVRLQRAFRAACRARGEVEKRRIVAGCRRFRNCHARLRSLGNGRRVRPVPSTRKTCFIAGRDKSGFSRWQIGKVRDDARTPTALRR